ncbi:MAG: DUF692 domain-containing protein [Rhizomicrobium sp.]
MSQHSATMPPRAGVGLKAQHYRQVIEHACDIGFFEVHAENYMGAGGPPHRYLQAVRERYPLSLHGVGLSIGKAGPLDLSHLGRLKELIARYQPDLFSEHLAWSSHGTDFYNDLLPVPYTRQTLEHICGHIDEVQEALARQILLENPSTYVGFAQSTYSEPQFIAEVAKRTGCGLLFDVNNVHVSCTNQNWDVARYIADYPLDLVQEIHLAGHKPDADEQGRDLLIDSHDRAVSTTIWQLYTEIIDITGALPTLIEWDNDVPEWQILAQEAQFAEAILQAPQARRVRHAALG